jgi:hypothetical protein
LEYPGEKRRRRLAGERERRLGRASAREGSDEGEMTVLGKTCVEKNDHVERDNLFC